MPRKQMEKADFFRQKQKTIDLNSAGHELTKFSTGYASSPLNQFLEAKEQYDTKETHYDKKREAYRIKKGQAKLIPEQSISLSVKQLVAAHEISLFTNVIIIHVKSLEGLEDIRDQICICASIKEQTLRLLKMIEINTEGNYQKACIHLFFQAIVKNYAKRIFEQSQLDLLVEILEESRKGYVSEERYFQLDEKLYNNKIGIFPEEE